LTAVVQVLHAMLVFRSGNCSKESRRDLEKLHSEVFERAI
jgi:hypothetical protein